MSDKAAKADHPTGLVAYAVQGFRKRWILQSPVITVTRNIISLKYCSFKIGRLNAR